jgi:hypothetical protein
MANEFILLLLSYKIIVAASKNSAKLEFVVISRESGLEKLF